MSFLNSKTWREFQRSVGREIFEINKDVYLIKMELPLGKNYLYSPSPRALDYLDEIKKIGQKQGSIFFKFEPLTQRTTQPSHEAMAGTASNEKRTAKLLKGKDLDKDQTYFLYRVKAEQLAHTMFPIGEYVKKDVRKLARKFNLPNADKKDSQGLCFIGKVDVNKFLKEYIPQKKGIVITTKGKKIGEHEGVQYYTIGQRKGIGIGGGIPYYVVGKDIKTNILTVGSKYDENLFANQLTIENISWVSGKPKLPKKYQASIRYRQEPQEVKITENFDGSLRLNFKEPQRAVTSGQSAVIYDGDVVLGGGIIV